MRKQERNDYIKKLFPHLKVSKKIRGEYFFHRGDFSKVDLYFVLNGKVGIYEPKAES
jgi:hypothetical protein